jgi:hypothetical protein
MTNKISQEPASSVNKSNIQTSFANVKLHILKVKKKGGGGLGLKLRARCDRPGLSGLLTKGRTILHLDKVHPA